MFKHVLVPVDFAENNRSSIDHGSRLTDPEGVLTLLHIIEEIENLDEREGQEFYNKLKAMAKDKMATWLEYAKKTGKTSRAKILIGKRVVSIVTYAAQHDVDLIVAGSHRLDWREPLKGFSTVSHQLAVVAQCPVMLVK